MLTKLNFKSETLEKLKQLAGTNTFNFLGFTLDLDKSTITDNLPHIGIKLSEWAIQILTTLLCHYSLANPIAPTGTLVKYKDIPGGYAYEGAFIKRAIDQVGSWRRLR
jgi:hypothetical protein